MRKIGFNCEINAAVDTIWKLLIEKVEQPQGYLPGSVQTRILQHYGNGVLREIKAETGIIKEKVVIDKGHGEIHYFLLEHPQFTGRVVNRVAPLSAQNPAVQLLTIEMDWSPKDEAADRLIRDVIPEQLRSELQEIKRRAEAMEEEEAQPLTTGYAFGLTIPLPYAEAVKRVQEELQKEGFGILSEIDVKQKFREKLHKEFRNYVILGACNPGLAYQAFGVELNIGTLLPCNVVLYSVSEARTVVMIMDPVAALSLVGNQQLVELAHTVNQAMQRVLKAL